MNQNPSDAREVRHAKSCVDLCGAVGGQMAGSFIIEYIECTKAYIRCT